MSAPLRTLVGWAVVGNLGLAVAQWGVVSVIAKGGGTADVGTFTLALALTAPLLAVSQVQLRAVLVTDAMHTTPFAVYRNLRLATTAAFVLLAPLVAALGDRGGRVVVVVSVFAIAKAFDSVADIFLGYQRCPEAEVHRHRTAAQRSNVAGVLLGRAGGDGRPVGHHGRVCHGVCDVAGALDAPGGSPIAPFRILRNGSVRWGPAHRAAFWPWRRRWAW